MSESRRGVMWTAVLALALCFAGATVAVGWWGVPIVGLVWGAWATRHAIHSAMIAPLAAASAVLAWAGLLIWTGTRGPLALLAATLGTMIGVPAAVLIAVTLGFAALLAWSAAAAIPNRDRAMQAGGAGEEATGVQR